MTYKQIEAAREVRLWICQIVVPAATVAVTAMTIPEVRQMIAAKADSVKYKIKSKINKREAQCFSFIFAKNAHSFMKGGDIYV